MPDDLIHRPQRAGLRRLLDRLKSETAGGALGTGQPAAGTALALEPRFMFDAAGIATAIDTAAQDAGTESLFDGAVQPVDQQLLDAAAQAIGSDDRAAGAPEGAQDSLEISAAPSTAQPVLDQAIVCAMPLTPESQVLRDADPAANSGRKEVAFIDTAIADYQTLVDGVKAGVEVVLLDGASDGLAQMAAWAEGKSGYDAIHVLSHGAEGQLHLGALMLDTATADARAADLAALGAALTDNGDLLLYGCAVASGTGESFIAVMAGHTGADVAASTDQTGTGRLNGNWVLEATSTASADLLTPSDGVRSNVDDILSTVHIDKYNYLLSVPGTTTNFSYASNAELTPSTFVPTTPGSLSVDNPGSVGYDFIFNYTASASNTT